MKIKTSELEGAALDWAVAADRRTPTTEYAEAAPFMWRLEAEAVFQADNGDEYRHTVEPSTDQVQLLGELTDTWREILREARDGGNPNHHSHDVVRAWPLVAQHARGDV